MAADSADPYIGCTISLISRSEIRYEGVLYFLSVQDSSIGLRSVKSYGTEGRTKDGPQVAPADKVYDYILFRGTDIKDLQVKSPAPAPREEQIHNDPAIIQSQYTGAFASTPPSPLVSGNSVTEITQWQDTPSLSTKSNTGVLPSCNSTTVVTQSGHSFSTQIASPPALSLPIYWQGYNEGAVNTPQHPHHLMHSPSAISHLNKASENPSSVTIGLVDTSASVTSSISSLTSISVNPNSPPLKSVNYSSALDMPSSLATQVSLLSHPIPVNASQLNMPTLLSPDQDWSMNKAISDPVPGPPMQSMPYPASSAVVSNAGSLLTSPPSLLTPDQLAVARSHILSPSQKLYLHQKNMDAMIPTPFNSSSSIPPPMTQAPLLPTPQSHYSTTQFSEEFDFLAMNEKFKKDEVWGYLGKEKQRDETGSVDDSATGQSLDGKDGCTKPAYNKDEFFDSISCNSLNRGGRSGHRFSGRMKRDSETFGNFQQRLNFGYGGYVPGRGGNYRSPYPWGRGYGYGGNMS